jgi:hypothetical protein
MKIAFHANSLISTYIGVIVPLNPKVYHGEALRSAGYFAVFRCTA